MEYTDFKRLIDSLLVKNKETEWIEFKENFHSKEEIGERLSAPRIQIYQGSTKVSHD